MATKPIQAEDEVRKLGERLVREGTPAADFGAALIKAGAVLCVQETGPAATVDGLRMIAQQIADEFPNDTNRPRPRPN